MVRNLSGVERYLNGAVAQLGERLLCKQEVVGSIPSSSTILRSKMMGAERSNRLI